MEGEERGEAGDGEEMRIQHGVPSVRDTWPPVAESMADIFILHSAVDDSSSPDILTTQPSLYNGESA